MISKNEWLSESQLSQACGLLPPVSVDLYFVYRADKQQCLLLGLRHNRPAQNFWFIPGGRIRKGETLDDSVLRISGEETGVYVNCLSSCKLLWKWDHIYSDSALGVKMPVHYANIAFSIHDEDIAIDRLPFSSLIQHRDWRWMPLAEIGGFEDVNLYVKKPQCY